MKLRYTSLQADVGAAEELLEASDLPPSLGGAPVVVCQLHSQVACVAAAFKHLAPSRRLVFVMTDWGALPVALSDLVADLCSAGLVDSVVSAGEAFGGDYEAVNVVSGLHVAVALAGADAVVVGPGPGVVGTGTPLGFTSFGAAAVLDAALDMGGRPLLCVRFSQADGRDRHRGVSHHALTVLDLVHGKAVLAVPEGAGAASVGERHSVMEVEVPDVAVEVTTMGRGADDDPAFFRYAGAAGVAAAELLGD